ncbi:MAG: 5-methyltetrahydropteroyltriglutamate--homocysteine S-methyltransferase [Bacteroidia bacterium]
MSAYICKQKNFLMAIKTLAYGLPKLGSQRQFKKLLESFWQKKIDEEALHHGMKALENERLHTYSENVDVFPACELSYYDPMLDLAIGVGAIPARFGTYQGLKTYFEMARGGDALEMTKWFNTNYHYLVPELEAPQFSLGPQVASYELYAWAHKTGFTQTLPSLIGPYTFLKLSKKYGYPLSENELLTYAEALLPVYASLLKNFSQADYLLLHEPAFVLDSYSLPVIRFLYEGLRDFPILLLTYYEGVDFYEDLVSLPIRGIGLDFVSSPQNEESLLRWGFPEDKILIAGLLDGRNVWKANLLTVAQKAGMLMQKVPEVWLAPSCPLSFLPWSAAQETRLPKEVAVRLAFAQEKLGELKLLKRYLKDIPDAQAQVEATAKLWQEPFGHHAPTRDRVSRLTEADFERKPSYAERKSFQAKVLGLPPLPTTTIGSFPQSVDVRNARKAFKEGHMSAQAYEAFIQQKIRQLIEYQEKIGLDVLVHGEFERSDMVEFFAEKLEGMTVTENGWVLSYGSRVYRAPIIYGDVYRVAPMTVKEILYAQSLTSKPVKGMLTGPVTILNWSYAPPHTPKEEVAYQIALAIQDEVHDLEKAGIKIIQIDEPAFREGAPLKKRDWEKYFTWAVKAFRLSAHAHRPEVQIHSHMCYSEFETILPYIWQMDFDVVSIEASRSKGTLVEEFKNFPQWDRAIGLGVYDIHSPAIPSQQAIEKIIQAAQRILSTELLWVNPDCGLKTRRWEEVTPAIENMVQAAQALRQNVPTS